jgi:hypothetical protein
MAFILSTKRDIAATVYTIRRMIVSKLENRATITRHWSYFSRLVSNLQKTALLLLLKSKIKIY